MKTITLFHLSHDLEKIDREFIPRIPVDLENDEDGNTPRICFSDSIEGCLSAMPSPNSYINDETGSAIFVLFKFECDLEDDNLILWRDLYESGRVPDSALTHECWYLKNLKLVGRKIEIKNMEYAYQNRIILKELDHKYRPLIDEVLERYNIDKSETEKLDTCKLINDYIPKRYGTAAEEIMSEIGSKIKVKNKPVVNGEIFKKLFDVDINKIFPQEEYVDWRERGVYTDLDVVVLN